MTKSIFEAIMLICFGAAWPFAVVKSYRARRNCGKSLHFLVVIFVGYVSGTVHKILNNPDAVIFLYILNGVMVAVDIALYFRNRALMATTCLLRLAHKLEESAASAHR